MPAGLADSDQLVYHDRHDLAGPLLALGGRLPAPEGFVPHQSIHEPWFDQAAIEREQSQVSEQRGELENTRTCTVMK